MLRGVLKSILYKVISFVRKRMAEDSFFNVVLGILCVQQNF
jgi:hypothetical protein